MGNVDDYRVWQFARPLAQLPEDVADTLKLDQIQRDRLRKAISDWLKKYSSSAINLPGA